MTALLWNEIRGIGKALAVGVGQNDMTKTQKLSKKLSPLYVLPGKLLHLCYNDE